MFDFPNSPSLGQQVTSTGGKIYTWDGTKWASTSTVIAAPGGVIVAPTPPTTVPNAMWWDSVGGQLYVYYDDGNTVQWVPATSATPLNAASKADVATALNDVGRNLVHNPLFNIAQRGVGPFSVSGYCLDRWAFQVNLDVSNAYQLAMGDGSRLALGDEEANLFASFVVAGNAGAASYTGVYQPVENIRRLAGKTVTLSFWACVNSGTAKVGVSFDQYFGTGGSPSARVNANGQAVNITNAFTRYSVTFAIPAISSIKTVGTNKDDATFFWLWFSSGTTQAARAGNIGVQNNTFNIWGVQLEVSPVATPLEKPDPQQDLAKCQRFYYAGNVSMYAYNTAGSYVTQLITLPVTMRANPIITPSITPSNVTGATVDVQTVTQVRVVGTATATGACNVIGSFTASADL